MAGPAAAQEASSDPEQMCCPRVWQGVWKQHLTDTANQYSFLAEEGPMLTFFECHQFQPSSVPRVASLGLKVDNGY